MFRERKTAQVIEVDFTTGTVGSKRTQTRKVRKTWLERHEARVDRSGGSKACHLSSFPVDQSALYPITTYKGVRMTRARAQWLARNGDNSIPAGMCLLHTCNNKGCMNPAHHYIGTVSQNQKDSVRDGVKFGLKKLSPAKARTIFKWHYEKGWSAARLAKRYGVDPANIRHILKRRSWTEATAPLAHLMTNQPSKAPATRRSANRKGRAV